MCEVAMLCGEMAFTSRENIYLVGFVEESERFGFSGRLHLARRWYSMIMRQRAHDPPVKNRYEQVHKSATHQTRLAHALAVLGRLLDDRRPLDEIERVIAAEPDPVLKNTLRYMADRVAFAREMLQFEPEGPVQEAALQTWSRRIIFLCNRQWGKSTIAAIRVLHRAWFWPGSLILLVSRTHAQSGGLLQKVKEFLPLLGISERASRGDGVNRLSVKLPNGSRIVALPGGQRPTRSYSKVAMVVIDEASIVPDPVHDAVAPTLARTNGELILASTPAGKRGSFYRAWMFGGREWFKVFGPVDAKSPISRAHLDLELARAGQDYVDQEYFCVFLDRDSYLFGEDSLQAVFSQDVETWEEL